MNAIGLIFAQEYQNFDHAILYLTLYPVLVEQMG